MKKADKIIVTGAAGLVGSTLVKRLQRDFSNVIPLTRKECDLEDRQKVRSVFEELKPDYVFHIAAKVGGINANITQPVEFLRSNILSQTYVIESSYSAGVKKLLFLGSSCIYPRLSPQPMKEEYLMTGPVEPTNEGYALAKIAGLKLAQLYHRQYGLRISLPMPCNIYGPGDSFDLENCHVLSALVRRLIEAKRSESSFVPLWGTGSAKREFLYIDDAVDGILFCMLNTETPEILNVGSGNDISIRDLAEMIAKMVGYKGELKWDHSKPDGMPRKCLDTSRLAKEGWQAKTSLEQGIWSVIQDFEARYPS